jgi:hypothetical protein
VATWLEDIVTAMENLGGSARYPVLYDEIERIRPNLPPTWQSGVRRDIERHSSDSEAFEGRRDVFFTVEGIGSGFWGLRSYIRDTPLAVDLPAGVDQPGRTATLTYRVLRDTTLARKIKLLHRDHCQICGLALELPDGATYSEAHHIIPLGQPHNGPDVAGNILVVCPNHHAQCDFGALRLDREGIRAELGHEISDESLRYHNERIYGSVLAFGGFEGATR